MIEVIVAIVILFMAVSAVLYFYSQRMESQQRIKEKYRLIRTAREFVDTFINDKTMADEENGQRETADFIITWKVFPAEEEKEIIFSSGRRPVAQLKRVHLEFTAKATGNRVLDLHFLINTISPPQ